MEESKYSQTICLNTTSYYDAMSSKKVKLNDGVSYRTVFMLPQTQNLSSSFQKTQKGMCNTKSASVFQMNYFENLKILLSQNEFELGKETSDENNFEKENEVDFSERMTNQSKQDLVKKTIEFIENYQVNSFQRSNIIVGVDPLIKIYPKEVSKDNQFAFRKGLKNLFYLYLNGDYRGINETFNLKENVQNSWEKATSNRYVSYKYKSKHINFDFTPKQEICQDDDEEELLDNHKEESNNKKQVIYNKSKYVMQFLLKLLDPQHLEYLEIPGGFEGSIGQIQKNIRETSKRNKMSQSQFYNHNHFDCLFLQITKENQDYITQNVELQAIHQSVFAFINQNKSQEESIWNPFSLHSMNLFKRIISQIILAQVDIIRNQIIPQLAISTISFKSSSKLKYFERICDSISKLDGGVIINKF